MNPFYKTFLLLFLNVSFLGFNSFGQQAPGIEWQNTIGGSSSDVLSSVEQTSDGGYILGGTSSSNISGDKSENSMGFLDYWVVKVDVSGNIQWQNTIGGSDRDDLFKVHQTTDGGYIIGGQSDSDISGDKSENSRGFTDYWIVKLNALGNIQWQRTIGGNAQDYFADIKLTTDDGYIIGGTSWSDSSGEKTENSFSIDYWVVKLDSLGNILWQNTIGGNDTDWLTSIQQTSDDGYVLTGHSNSNISGDKTENNWNNSHDYWVVKIDSIGNIQWQNTIGGYLSDDLYSIDQTSNGGFIAGGNSNSDSSGDKTENCMGNPFQGDFWVVRLNLTGGLKWQNTIGGSDQEEFAKIQETSDDGGYIIGGSSSSNISGDKTENSVGEDFWIVKLDTIGNIQWQNTIGGNQHEKVKDIQQTSDNGYILGGWSTSNISGDKTENCLGNNDYWIVKLFPDTITSIPNYQLPITNYQIFPNPSSGIFQITFPSSTFNQEAKYTLEVVNTLGQTVFATQPETKNQKPETQLNLSFLPKGIYVLMINDGINSFSKKLVIQ